MTHHEGNIPEPKDSLNDLPDEVVYGRGVSDGGSLPASPEYISAHGVDYPAGFARLYVRELLHLSQTNVTADSVLGERYAAAAYDKARQDKSGSDPTAAGEAAAKAGFRATQAGAPDERVDAWFLRSIDALGGPDEKKTRERAATDILHARSTSLRALRNYEPAIRPGAPDTPNATSASALFEHADQVLRRQHRHGGPWDRYATMLSRHRATHEAVFGPRYESAQIALGGVWQAIRARRENSPEARPLRNALEHAKFVAKHVLMNTVALGLAATQPRTDDSRWARKHRAIAAKVIS